MIGALRGVSAYAYGEPRDMRKSFDTLAALVRERLERDLMSGDKFLFVSRDRASAESEPGSGVGGQGARARLQAP
jgi:transposase